MLMNQEEIVMIREQAKALVASVRQRRSKVRNKQQLKRRDLVHCQTICIWQGSGDKEAREEYLSVEVSDNLGNWNRDDKSETS